jgi:FixJ family two-component response regulator
MFRRLLVSVVDDNESVRESLPDLLREFGFAVNDLQRELMLQRQEIPIIFITAQKDEAFRLRVLEQGAVECLFKPFSDTALLEAVNAALRLS